MFKTLGCYWVRVVSHQHWNGESGLNYETRVVMAYSLEEAESAAPAMGYYEWSTDASGVFDLSVFHRLKTCDEHPAQFVDIVVHGALYQHALDRKTPPKDFNPVAFKAWCAAGAHWAELPWDDITNDMVARAAIGADQ